MFGMWCSTWPPRCSRRTRRIADGIAGVGLPLAGAAPAAMASALRRLVEVLVPPVEAFVRRAQEVEVLRAELAPWWVISTLYAVTYSAWQGVAAGRLAPLDAAGLAFDTLVRGVGTTS